MMIDSQRGNLLSANEPFDIGLYAYVNNDPVNKIDPLGLEPTAPVGVPETFVYNYTEAEFSKNRIAVGDYVQFGKYQYMAVSRRLPETVPEKIRADLWSVVKGVATLGEKFDPGRL